MGGSPRRSGFTLIELLVVIAIIAVLIAILIPSLGSVKQKANRIRCATNLRTLSQADLMYANEWGGIISRNSGAGIPTVFWLLCKQQKIPIADFTTPSGGWEGHLADTYRKVKWLNCPAFPDVLQPISYVVNAFDPRNPNNTNPPTWIALKRMHRSGELVAFTDGNTALPQNSFDVYDLFQPNHVDYTKQIPPASAPIPAGDQNYTRTANEGRHGKLINQAFYDGRVEPKEYKKVTVWDYVSRINP